MVDLMVVLGWMKFNFGLRICKQEFLLSCYFIVQVVVMVSFEDVYFIVNMVCLIDYGNFFVLLGVFINLQVFVKYVYFCELMGSFKVQLIVFLLLNSRYVSGMSGVLVIFKVSFMEVLVNVKQFQDFLLFREIWLLREVLENLMVDVVFLLIVKFVMEMLQGYFVQWYQQVVWMVVFFWMVSISIMVLKINVDLGQVLGKLIFLINDFWVFSKKMLDWE